MIELYWIPLGAGAGGALVRVSGRVYESVAAVRARRPRCRLYHSALVITTDDAPTVIEMAPVWVHRGVRGVVAEGPVGARALGRLPLFRYEVRCWLRGCIPDVDAAVGGAVRIDAPDLSAARVLDLAPSFPTLVWGRDELGVGDMWNSNSLVSWLLVSAGVDIERVPLPEGGRAPGWNAGIVAANEELG